jgi:hypothetical protein
VKYRTFLLLLFSCAALYFSAAALTLRFGTSRILFPYVAYTGSAAARITDRVSGPSGNIILIRRYGAPLRGCVVFFPGQHGGISSYEKTLFPKYVSNGIAVFALSYPGQDGAAGQSDLDEIQHLVQRALRIVGRTCPATRTVFVGRSLGSMLAAYAAGLTHPAGVVLEGAAPSLSSAIIVRLRMHWYLSPISLLPISELLPRDYRLVEGLSDHPPFSVVVFQGTADEQTPIQDLRAPGALPRNSRLIAVDGGTHSNTYNVAMASYIQCARNMLRDHKI